MLFMPPFDRLRAVSEVERWAEPALRQARKSIPFAFAQGRRVPGSCRRKTSGQKAKSSRHEKKRAAATTTTTPTACLRFSQPLRYNALT